MLLLIRMSPGEQWSQGMQALFKGSLHVSKACGALLDLPKCAEALTCETRGRWLMGQA
jgi:hypothetical protein